MEGKVFNNKGDREADKQAKDESIRTGMIEIDKVLECFSVNEIWNLNESLKNEYTY